MTKTLLASVAALAFVLAVGMASPSVAGPPTKVCLEHFDGNGDPHRLILPEPTADKHVARHTDQGGEADAIIGPPVADKAARQACKAATGDYALA